MKTYEKTSIRLPHKARPTGIESVRFHDGMLVSADDLGAASTYAVSLLQVALRAHLGCGVVCGLGLRVRRRVKTAAVWTVCVDRGTAVDCRGYPVELLAPVELDLTPDPCACEPPPSTVLIALRRITSDEATHDACSCADHGSEPGCSRVRDQALVRAFTEDELRALPGGVCRREAAGGTAEKGAATATMEVCREGQTGSGDSPGWCEALTECGGCGCDADWVLLGSVTLDADTGIVGTPDTSGRRRVKPVEALCALAAMVGQVTDLQDEVADLTRRLASLEENAQRQVKPTAARKTPAS